MITRGRQRFDFAVQWPHNDGMYGTGAVRLLGWAIAMSATILPLAALAWEQRQGPPGGIVPIPSPRQRVILARTFAVAAGTSLLATLAAIPAIVALARARSTAARWLLLSLTLLPLLAPPCVFGYAWMLLSSPQHVIGRVLSALGMNADGAAGVRAAVAMSAWLWPIPALLIVAAYRHGGQAALRLALLDASRAGALLRAALPAMSSSIAGAALLAFVLALNESTVAPLVLARTWPAEVGPELLDASLYGSRTRAIVWMSWPIMLAAVAAILLAWPALVRARDEYESDASADLGRDARPRSALVRVASFAMVALIATAAPAIFVIDLARSRVAIGPAVERAWTLYRHEWRASLTVALLSALAAALVLFATLRVERATLVHRLLVRGLLVLAVITALLPPELTAELLIQVFNRPGWPGRLYDETPLVWTLGVLVRFSFVPLSAAVLLSSRVPIDLVRQARADGAATLWATLRAIWPHVLPVSAAAALLVGCLALAEVPASLILTPARYGGPIAVALDNQMHYGRNADVIVSTLILMLPAIAGATGAAGLLVAAGRIRRESASIRTFAEGG